MPDKNPVIACAGDESQKMKALICIAEHEPDQWFFEKLCDQYGNFTETKYVTQDVEIEEEIRPKLSRVLMAFMRYGFRWLDYKTMALHDKKMLEVFTRLPESSSLSKDYRQDRIDRAGRNLKWKKTRLLFFYYYFLSEMRNFDILFIYNGSPSIHKCAIEAARRLGKKTIFIEVGPFLNTITMDVRGINYENSLPRQTSFYKDWFQKKSAASETDETISKKPQIEIRKKRIEFKRKDVLDLNRKYIFLPLQTFFDTQMNFGGWISNIPQLIEVVHDVSQHLPHGWHIITKEHPRCIQRYNLKEIETDRFIFANGNETPDLIANASLIITLNSTIGLEAMLFDKPVVVLGKAFYSFGDLTFRCENKKDLIEIIKHPEKISFNAENRRAFIAYLINEYYMEGNFHTKTFSVTQKNRRLISSILSKNKNAG